VEFGNSSTEVVVPEGETMLEVLDIPSLPQHSALSDARQPYLLIAAAATTSNWRGAMLYKSTDHRHNFQEAASISRLCTMGHAIEPLGIGTPGITDLSSSVIVNLQYGELYSIDRSQWSETSNLCLLGDEILQFEVAELIGLHQYKLSVFHRGRCGTHYNTGGHKAGERFVLLDEAIAMVPMANSEIGQKLYFKALTAGRDALPEIQSKGMVFEGESVKAYPCIHLSVSTSGVFSWVGVNKSYIPLRDYVSVPAEGIASQYLVHVIGHNQETLFTYQTADTWVKITLPTDEISHIKVCQLNAAFQIGAWASLSYCKSSSPP
jgi:hypothetical protein